MDAGTMDSEAHDVAFAWVLRARWGGVLGAAVALVVARRLMGEHLDPAPLVLLAVMAVSNLIAHRLPVATRRPAAALLLAFDVLALSAILAATGGPTNPFSILYLVYVTLAATSLGGRATAALTGLAIAAYGALFLLPGDAGGGPAHHHGAPSEYAAHLYGMFLAFATSGALVAFFVGRLASDLGRTQRQLQEARARSERAARLSALTTLSAGAAHELGTPLGTIGLVAKELEHALEQANGSGELQDDARLIRSEVDRCRAILDRMAGRAGDAIGSAPTPCDLRELTESVVGRLHERQRRRVTIEGSARGLSLPRTAMMQAIENVIRNGLDAGAETRVVVSIHEDEGGVAWVCKDDGGGMSPSTLARVGEPFFTTKEPGQGMGLGVYLSRQVVERSAGKLTLRSVPGEGTEVIMEFAT